MLESNKAAYGVFLAFAAAFMLIASKGLAAPQPGDENTYYYMGKLVTEGKIPYRDFFYAHPPLHIYILALFYKIFGFNIIALKSIPLLSTLASAFFIFKIARARFGNAEALASSALFMFSYSVMFNSVFSFGTDVAAMLLVIGVYFLLVKGNHLLAGAFFGAAASTRLLSLVPIAAIMGHAALSGRSNFIKLSSVFLLVFLLFSGIFIFFAGKAYLEQAYLFHLLKSPGIKENAGEYWDMVKLNWILFASAFLFFFAKERKKIRMFALVSGIYLVFLMPLRKIFGFYFMIAMPFLAITAGCSIVDVLKNLRGKWKFIASAALLAVFAWNLSSDVVFLGKIGFTGFERGHDLRDFILANSDSGTLLFGDDSAVPLLALMTDRHIAFDYADTNEQVFMSGLADLNKVLGSLKGSDVMLIVRSTQGISSFRETRDFLNTNCGLLGSFHSKSEGDYIFYKCR